ncbi:hypothetical protein AgCh_031860 [Apium graveolens]
MKKAMGWKIPVIQLSWLGRPARQEVTLDSYMAVSDDRKRVMPTFEDMQSGTPLAYPASERSSIKGFCILGLHLMEISNS